MGNLWTQHYRITTVSLSWPAKATKQKSQDKSLHCMSPRAAITWLLNDVCVRYWWNCRNYGPIPYFLVCKLLCDECPIDYVSALFMHVFVSWNFNNRSPFFSVLRKKKVWRREPSFILRKMEKRARMGWAGKMKRDEKMEMETLIMNLKRWEKWDLFIIFQLVCCLQRYELDFKKSHNLWKICMPMFYENEAVIMQELCFMAVWINMRIRRKLFELSLILYKLHIADSDLIKIKF